MGTVVPRAADGGGATLVFFWGVGCPHCEDAKTFLQQLAMEEDGLIIESIEVRQDPAGSARFVQEMTRRGAQAVGVPTIVVADRYIVGFRAGASESQIRRLVQEALASGRAGDEPAREIAPPVLVLPLVGAIDPAELSLPVLTVLIGLLDGFNPCAMWVLLVLLSILVHVRSRSRLLLLGGTFVLMSGVVYFLFMTAWVTVFQLLGLSTEITVMLGVTVLVMGLINLKEMLWFREGISLTISDRVKPTLYRRMRGVAAAASLPAAVMGIAVLAFIVNLVELGCTIGLPAVYTRMLSVRQMAGFGRYAYLVLYNLAYIVPLALVVVAYGTTLHRFTLGEREAKILKALSGAALVIFGLVLIAAPELLAGGW